MEVKGKKKCLVSRTGYVTGEDGFEIYTQTRKFWLNYGEPSLEEGKI